LDKNCAAALISQKGPAQDKPHARTPALYKLMQGLFKPYIAAAGAGKKVAFSVLKTNETIV
jgi:hypothetical protein